MTTSSNIVATKYNLLFGYANILILIIKNIIVIPFYLHFFSLNIVGLWLATSNILTIFSSIDLGLNIILTQRLTVEKTNGDSNNFMKIFISARYIFLIISVVFFFICLLYSFNLKIFFKIPDEFLQQLFYSLILTSIGLAFNIIIQTYTSLCQALKTTFETGISFLIANIFEIILLFVFLYKTRSLISIGISIFLASFLNLILHFIIYKRLSKKFELKIINHDKLISIKLLKASLPLFFSRITRTIVNNSQATILSIFVNNQSAAIFEISAKLYKTALMFLAPIGSSIFSTVASSFAYASKSQKKENMFIFKQKVKKVIILFLSIACILFSYIAIINYNFIVIWAGKSSFGGSLLTILCLFSFFFQTLSRFLTFILNSINVISIISKFEIIEMTLRIILLAIFVKYFGIYGIPISEILSTGIILLPRLFVEFKKPLSIDNISILSNAKEEFGFIIILICSVLFSLFYSKYFDSYYSFISISIIYFIITLVIIIKYSRVSKKIILNLISTKSILKSFY